MKRLRWPADFIEHCRWHLAREYFGIEWQAAIRECDEAHLEGDCVLCDLEK